MFTAFLHLSPERATRFGVSDSFLKIRNRFQSKITIQRGDSKPLDISIDEQLKELTANPSADLRIIIEGRDEMKAACRIVDLLNHGGGI